MTVSSQTNNVAFVGNGVATAFPLPFRFFKNSDIRAYFIDSTTGASTPMVLGTDYTLSGEGEPEVDGNALSVLTTTVPLANLRGLYVERIMEQVQETDIVNQGEFFAATHEDVFDRLTMLIQQSSANSTGAIRVAIGDPEPRRLLPAAQRANQILAFDALGEPITVAPVSGSAIDLAIQLANQVDPSKGSGMVGHNPAGGHPANTVGAALVSLNAEVDQAQADINAIESGSAPLLSNLFSTSVDPMIVDLHWGSLRGAGWTSVDPVFNPDVDPINVKTVNATDAISATGTDVPVNASTGFAAGMLCCYLGTDNQFHSVQLQAILAGPVFRFAQGLPVAIASGAPIHNFYRDDAHPNTKGGAAIVDYAITQLSDPARGRIQKLEFLARDGSIWSAIGAASLASLTSVDYRTLGSSTVGERCTQVSGTGVDQGAASQYVGLLGGDYLAKLPVNLGLRSGGLSGSIVVAIQERRQDNTVFTIATSAALTGYDGNLLVEIPFSCAPGSAISVRVTSPNGGNWTFNIGSIEFHRLEGQSLNLNRGKHVLFGDSWFSVGSAMATRFIERLNNAVVAVKGVGGNKADQLIARFQTDVVPENPDFVWIMVGTNDYYASVTHQLFEQQIHQLRRLVQAIGAQPIFFTPSVGALFRADAGPQVLHASRRYVLNVRYAPQAACLGNGSNEVWRSAQASIQSLSVAAGATVTAFVCPGFTRKEAILRFLGASTAAVNIRLGYSGSVDGSGPVEETVFATTSMIREAVLPRASDTALRFPCLRINNPTGGAVVVSVIADITWPQDLV